MTKYNYKKASDLFNKYFDMCCDPWTVTEDEKRCYRREFMWSVTRGEVSEYIDYIKEQIQNVCRPYDIHGCYDFQLEKQYTDLIDEIVNF